MSRPEPPETIEILTAKQVAGLLGLDPKTVLAGARRGELPARQVGRRWLFERGALVRWLRETRSGGAEDRETRSARLQPSTSREDRLAKTRATRKRVTQ